LDSTQEHLRAQSFNHLGAAVAQLTLAGNLLTVNDQLCRLIDRSRSEIVEKSFKDLFRPEESWSEFDTKLAQLVASEIDGYSIELSANTPDGRIVWFDVLFSLISEDVLG
jgi:PAS domain S-box-containing protein